MAAPSTRHKHVRVQLVLRKSLKRRSKRAKHRKHTNKSSRVARSLITHSLLRQNTRFTYVSVARCPASTAKKLVKNKNKKSGKFAQADLPDQQQIYNSETRSNNIQSLEQPKGKNSKHNIQVFNTAEQIHCTKLNNYSGPHLNVLELSCCPNNNINSTKDKIVPPSFHKLSSNQTNSLISLSLHQPDRKDVNLLHNTTGISSSPLIDICFSAIIKSNKKSSVHPINEQHYPSSLQKKKKNPRFALWKLVLAVILLTLLIAGIIIAIVIPLVMRKTMIATTTAVPMTTKAPACTTSSSVVCSTLMYHYLNVNFQPPGAWTLVSCCYIAPTMNQITIEIAVQDDTGGYWLLDDMGATQGNAELISNGGFENNMTDWTLIVYSNATSAITVDSLSTSQHTGSAYLYGASINAPAYVKQTFSVIQGQNILISFWWDYFPPFGGGAGTSELTVTLT